MNGAHLHLILNHIPIIGSAFALLLLVYGKVSKNSTIENVALATVVLVALISVPVYLSGEEAEHAVDGMISISQSNIETHEDQAEIAYWLILMCGAISLGTLLSAKNTGKASAILVWINLAILLIVTVLMFRVGYSGGLIHHPEINTTESSGDSHENDH